MPALTDIITGFDAIRAEGAAFVADSSTSTDFQLVDVDRVLALHRSGGKERVCPKVYSGTTISPGAFFLVWQRRDGAFGAMRTLGGEETSIEGTKEGLRVALKGPTSGPHPVVAFAVAADPFVAADFCRAAANKVNGAETFADDSSGFRVDLASDSIDAAAAVYTAAVSAIWSRPQLTSTGPSNIGSSAGLEQTFRAAARELFASPVTLTRDRLFVDCRIEPRLLKAFAHKGRDGVLALFHCQHQNADAPITDTWQPDDVEGLGGEQFAAWHAVERKLFIIDRGVEETVTMPPMGAEIIHLVPILQNVAPLGLIDKLNASAAMTRMGSRKCRLTDGGTVGWYAAKRPTQVLLDGIAIEFEYEQANGLVTFVADEGRPHDSEVIL
jgi:hypothetical protein